jgi:phenylpropionate dioxygenase-like ring-hydroxylating dioxygenase large terminal subunit
MSTWRQEIHDRYYLLWSEFAGTLGVLQGETGFPPMPGFSLDRPERHTLAIMLPSTVLTATVDAIWWVTLFPTAAESTTVVVCHAFPEGVRALPDYDAIAERYFRRFDLVNVEDNEIVERQHRGLMQSLRQPGPYAPQEMLVHAFSRYVVDAVAPVRV